MRSSFGATIPKKKRALPRRGSAEGSALIVLTRPTAVHRAAFPTPSPPLTPLVAPLVELALSPTPVRPRLSLTLNVENDVVIAPSTSSTTRLVLTNRRSPTEKLEQHRSSDGMLFNRTRTSTPSMSPQPTESTRPISASGSPTEATRAITTRRSISIPIDSKSSKTWRSETPQTSPTRISKDDSSRSDTKNKKGSKLITTRAKQHPASSPNTPLPSPKNQVGWGKVLASISIVTTDPSAPPLVRKVEFVSRRKYAQPSLAQDVSQRKISMTQSAPASPTTSLRKARVVGWNKNVASSTPSTSAPTGATKVVDWWTSLAAPTVNVLSSPPKSVTASPTMLQQRAGVSVGAITQW